MWFKPRQTKHETDLLRAHIRLEALESVPVPQDPGEAVRSVEANLERLIAELARQREDRHDLSIKMVQLEANVEEIRAKVEKWTAAIAEGIERTERSERRIRSTVERARKELKSLGFAHEGLDAENAQLRIVDGANGAVEGLSEVPEIVERGDDSPSSVPGITLGQLRRARGME